MDVNLAGPCMLSMSTAQSEVGVWKWLAEVLLPYALV